MQFRAINAALMLSARAAQHMVQAVDRKLLPARPQHKQPSPPAIKNKH